MKIIAFILLTLFITSVHSGSLCSFSKFGMNKPVSNPSQRAKNEAQAVINVLGVQGQAAIYRGGSVQNAAAYTAGSFVPGIGQVAVDTILYNPDFLNQMESRGRWATASIIAHELGHFLGTARVDGTSWGRELGADFWSGCALSRMGVSYPEATVALKSMFNAYGSQTHPDTPRRLKAMQAGYEQCGN